MVLKNKDTFLDLYASLSRADFRIPFYTHDHSRPVIGYGNFTFNHFSPNAPCYIPQDVVTKKLALWDYVLKNNLLSSSDPILRSNSISLLNDKTIKAYALMKTDGNPVRMMYMQDAILSDPHDRILFAGCNQHIGKSFCLNLDAATEFITDHNKNWIGILVSGSLPQSQFQMERIKLLLKSTQFSYKEESTIDKRTGKKDNTTQVSYTFYAKDGKTPLYRNLLICCPHTSSALGYPVDTLYLDEFDFWDNCDQVHFMFQIAIPRTFQTKGRIKVFTNPDGQDKMMHSLWNLKDAHGNPFWHRYNFNYWDKPGANQLEFNRSIVGMTKNQIESTLLGMFTRTGGSFFSREEIKDMLSQDLVEKGDDAGFGKETVWFADIGSVHDQSFLCGGYLEQNPNFPEIPLIQVFYLHKYPVGYPIARVVGIDSAVKPDDGWDDYVEDNPSIKHTLVQYSETVNGKLCQPIFGFDATGNSGIVPLFAAAGVEGLDVQFQGKNKWKMYQRYQYYVQQQFIKLNHSKDYNTL